MTELERRLRWREWCKTFWVQAIWFRDFIGSTDKIETSLTALEGQYLGNEYRIRELEQEQER